MFAINKVSYTEATPLVWSATAIIATTGRNVVIFKVIKVDDQHRIQHVVYDVILVYTKLYKIVIVRLVRYMLAKFKVCDS